jgi:hypothetical protein
MSAKEARAASHLPSIRLSRGPKCAHSSPSSFSSLGPHFRAGIDAAPPVADQNRCAWLRGKKPLLVCKKTASWRPLRRCSWDGCGISATLTFKELRAKNHRKPSPQTAADHRAKISRSFGFWPFWFDVAPLGNSARGRQRSCRSYLSPSRFVCLDHWDLGSSLLIGRRQSCSAKLHRPVSGSPRLDCGLSNVGRPPSSTRAMTSE